MHSYHVFLFPFQWEWEGCNKLPFSERFNLNQIKPGPGSMWENIPFPKEDHYVTELYNEKNFFYTFVHKIMFDNGETEFPAIRHYERREAYETSLDYVINVKSGGLTDYILKIKSICLDLFSTGTGMLIFYLENWKYSDFKDIKRINQFGRRVFPPFMGYNHGVEETKNAELANYIQITGLMGDPKRYYEDFTLYKPSDDWKPAGFIISLIDDLKNNHRIEIKPVVDDRMFTMCWTFNDEISGKIKSNNYREFVRGNEWHEYLYVDSGGSTCQNDAMQARLLRERTYPRWQKYGKLYGITRHSLMVISENNQFDRTIFMAHFRTIYVRIVELVLLQRSSVLKFSDEVTRLSTLSKKDTQILADEIDKFYQAYIRFINQVYFREITAQDQGIELYDMLHNNLRMKEQVKDLDDEISELHNYATMLDDKMQNSNLNLLTLMGSLFLVPSFIVGFFGMNLISTELNEAFLPFVIGLVVFLAGALYSVVWLKRKEKNKASLLVLVSIIVIILGAMLSTLIFR